MLHEIADGSKDEPKSELEKELKEAGFAQFPKGWGANGVALGGPAKPGTATRAATPPTSRSSGRRN